MREQRPQCDRYYRIRDGRRQTLLQSAARGGNIATLKYLLVSIPIADMSEALSTIDRFHRSPLHWAIMNENFDCVRILLENGADVDQEIKHSVKSKGTHLPYETPRQVAERKCISEILELIDNFERHGSF